MAQVDYDRAFFRTANRAPEDVRAHLTQFLRALEAASTPDGLPGDSEVLIPPGIRWWRRTFGTTGWCVYYSVTAGGFLVRSVTTLKVL